MKSLIVLLGVVLFGCGCNSIPRKSEREIARFEIGSFASNPIVRLMPDGELIAMWPGHKGRIHLVKSIKLDPSQRIEMFNMWKAAYLEGKEGPAKPATTDSMVIWIEFYERDQINRIEFRVSSLHYGGHAKLLELATRINSYLPEGRRIQ